MAAFSLHLLPRVCRPSLPLRHTVARPSAANCLVPRLRQRSCSTSNGQPSSMPASAETTPGTVADDEAAAGEERFDWLDQWYPVAPVCDLDPRAPYGKTVMGLSVVAWFDGGGEWRVFDDACPHRLAPLSEGRVDGKGRLQCAYHGWCFDGHGSCQFIPQAPALGPPVHKNSKACVASYPSVVQNNILWFYPRSEPEYSDALQRKRPPYIPDIDDPSSFTIFGTRDLPYGYELLIVKLMDPAHAPYAHKGLFPDRHKMEDPVEFDQECGVPIKMRIEDANIDGFRSKEDDDWGHVQFVAPCTLLGLPFRNEPVVDQGKRSKEKKKKKLEVKVMFLCVPVAPGKSRVIWAFSLTVVSWLDKMMPRWLYHIRTNSILDSDTYLLHIEERNFARVGLDNWHKVCYVPTSSDNFVIAFRNWFRKYCCHQVGWLTPNVNHLPPATTRVEILERYWSHVMQCTSCRAALKGMRALEITLQVASVAVVGFLAAAKETAVTSGVQRAAVVAAAVLCFAASRWLANFIEKTFYFQDYVHADK